MRIWFFSDFHLEHGKIPERSVIEAGIPEADICVVPGDMHTGHYAVSLLAEMISPHMPVIYVPGNHDYYGTRMPEIRNLMVQEALKHNNFYLMDPGAKVIGGVRFIGATLWTDYALNGEETRGEAMAAADRMLNDHRMIGHQIGDDAVWLPRHALIEHRHQLQFLEEKLSEPFDGRTVVVTHHGPTPESVHPRFRDPQFKLLNAAFVSDLRNLINRYEPDLWLHGHIHDTVDYHVGKTRVVSNPRGYQHEQSYQTGVKYARDAAGNYFDLISGIRLPAPYSGPENRVFNPSLILEV